MASKHYTTFDGEVGDREEVLEERDYGPVGHVPDIGQVAEFSAHQIR